VAYLSQTDLEAMGFAALGRNVRISDRAALHGAADMRIGDYSRIDDFCVLSGRITIGRNVHVAPFGLIAGGAPGVVLEDFSGLAYRVSIFAQSDDYSGETMTNPTVPARFKREARAAVRIGRHVILGTGSIICPGVDLGDGSAVGAGSLVLKSCPPFTILAGSPARKLKDRRQDLLALEAAYLAQEDLGPLQ
jgi:acetyltransferase-like isoleucine patch superfamily enzyme